MTRSSSSFKAAVSVAILGCVFLCGTQHIPSASAAGATNEEIREGVSSLMHSVNVLDDKLGRHEGRERVLGDSIRKGLAALQKGQQAFPALKASFSRLEDRVGQIETMLVSQEERAAVQQNKLADALEAIYKFMNENAATKYSVIANGGGKDDSEEEDIPRKIDDLVETIKELRREVSELKADRASADSESKAMIQRSSVVLQEAVGSKLDEKLAQLYVTSPHNDFEQQVKEVLAEIRGKIADGVSGGNTGLATRDPVDSGKTLEAIEDLKVEVLTAVDKSLIKMSSRIQESSDGIQAVVGEIAKAVAEQAESTTGLAEGQEQMLKNTENVKNLDNMLLQTADNIFDTKKKIELSVHRIHQDVSEMMGQATKELNATLMERLDHLDTTMMENHMGALTNLSNKIETEMNQVWRQIGIMYQEISSSKMSLDKLQQQTEMYVNGSITTMDNMKGKVGLVTDRISEVDENLNYLLGRLSLVTQEFNQIKSGLGTALESIRSSFQDVQRTVQKNVGPGPHPIDDRDEPDNHLMRKRLIRRRV